MKAEIKEIKVEKKDDKTKRVRKDFGDIVSLADSIKNHGLLHPIVVDTFNEPPYKWILVAGERRVQACLFNGYTDITITLLNEMTAVDRKEVELEENIIRQDLSWMERCEILRQLDELKRKKFGSASRSHDIKGWSFDDTAEVAGMSQTAVALDIKLAKDLKASPKLRQRVAKLPKHAARKIVKQSNEADMLRKQIERKELIISADLRQGDCCELIDTLADESIHMLLTDPPFGSAKIVNVTKSESQGSGMPTYNTTPTNVSDDNTMRNVYKKLIPKLYKKLIPGAHVYVFFGHGWYCELIAMLRATGFIIDASPLIWHKCRVSIQAKDMHYMQSYEAVLFGYKPPVTRILTKPVPNVLSIPALAPQSRAHPLQKPFDLLKIFIENSSNPGEIVLDTFAGSASTLVSARKLERSAIGFEIDNENYLRAQKFMANRLKGM